MCWRQRLTADVKYAFSNFFFRKLTSGIRAQVVSFLMRARYLLPLFMCAQVFERMTAVTWVLVSLCGRVELTTVSLCGRVELTTATRRSVVCAYVVLTIKKYNKNEKDDMLTYNYQIFCLWPIILIPTSNQVFYFNIGRPIILVPTCSLEERLMSFKTVAPADVWLSELSASQ